MGNKNESLQLEAIKNFCVRCAKKSNIVVDECGGANICPLYEYRFGVDFKTGKTGIRRSKEA